MTASKNVCLLVNVSIETNSVDPNQTAPKGAVCFGSTLFVEEASKTFKQTTKADNHCCIGTLRVNKCDFQFIYGHDFHEMHTQLKQLINHVNSKITCSPFLSG